MSQWYVRDRGRKMGPYSHQQVLDLRARGQVQGYHEVSRDGHSWNALDLTADFAPPSPPAPAKATMGRPVAVTTAAPSSPSFFANRQFQIIVGIVILLLVSGSTVLGVLLLRPSGKSKGNFLTTSPGSKVVNFDSKTTATERTKRLTEVVGLIVCGTRRKMATGSTVENWGEFVVRPPESVLRFPNVFNIIKYENRLLATLQLPGGTGTGFLINPDGYMLTNDHVIHSIKEYKESKNRIEHEKALDSTIEAVIWVFFGAEQKYEASIVYTSEKYDMAILKINGSNLSCFSLCETPDEQLPNIKSVTALGYPGYDRDAQEKMNINKQATVANQRFIQNHFDDSAFRYTETQGGIRKTQFKIRPEKSYGETLAVNHSAAIEWGNSGGPLIADDGTVIGINTNVLPISLVGREIGDDKDTRVRMVRPGQNYSITFPQMRREIEKHAPGVVWRAHPE